MAAVLVKRSIRLQMFWSQVKLTQTYFRQSSLSLEKLCKFGCPKHSYQMYLSSPLQPKVLSYKEYKHSQHEKNFLWRFIHFFITTARATDLAGM